MSLRFLLDTNVISELLRPAPNETMLEKFQLHQVEICIAAIVWHELLYGCYSLTSSNKHTAIESFLFDVVAPSIPILPYDKNAAHWHAMERARLKGIGKTPSFVNGQIAAIAKVNDLTLVSFNTSDFENFTELHLLDWRNATETP
jgi:tRNA(fMet)-specific endonuclease VapC